jgi:hypothetical protein
MSTKEKARQPRPGKDSSEPVVHCAACGAGIREGEPAGWAYMPVGVSFEGRLLGERLRLCGACVSRAKASEQEAEAVQKAVVDRYHGSADAVYYPPEFMGAMQ